jgi:hypothetical protein
MRRPAVCNSGGCGENPGRRTDKERRTGMVGTGRMHRLIPVAALALAGGTQDRCRGKSLAMAPTTQRTIVVGSSTCGHEPSDPEAGWAMTPAGVVG